MSLLMFSRSRQIRVFRDFREYMSDTTRSNTMAKTILQGTVDGRRGIGRPRSLLQDNIVKWTGLEKSKAL